MDEKTESPSYPAILARTAGINAAAAAGMVVGMFGGLWLVGTIISKKETQPEPAES